MTVKELAAALQELVEQGYGELPACYVHSDDWSRHVRLIDGAFLDSRARADEHHSGGEEWKDFVAITTDSWP